MAASKFKSKLRRPEAQKEVLNRQIPLPKETGKS